VNPRFTVDGSDELEAHLTRTCGQVLDGVSRVVPHRKLEALVLGGGYGRGEGGVLKTDSGDRPYNDLEFYVFVRGNILFTERKYRELLHALGDILSPSAGLHVEFKVYSVEKLRRSAVSMFSYDLVSRHRMIYGGEEIFEDCGHHLAAENIPPHEATRLLFNRCSGLLLAKDFLRSDLPTGDQQDFVGRNLAKAQLAFGDSLLALSGKYHWSCLERAERLKRLPATDASPLLGEIQRHHSLGVDFKLLPRRTAASNSELAKQHQEISALGQKLWLWIESRRLNCPFSSARDYAFSNINKCPESRASRNWILNLNRLSPAELFSARLFRYPRESLMNALCLLLWDNSAQTDPVAKRQLQQLLNARSSDWQSLIEAYKAIWQNYG
jgi:hypothetical protein